MPLNQPKTAPFDYYSIIFEGAGNGYHTYLSRLTFINNQLILPDFSVGWF